MTKKICKKYFKMYLHTVNILFTNIFWKKVVLINYPNLPRVYLDTFCNFNFCDLFQYMKSSFPKRDKRQI